MKRFSGEGCVKVQIEDRRMMDELRFAIRPIVLIALLQLCEGVAVRTRADELAPLESNQPDSVPGEMRIAGRSVGGRPIHCQEFGDGDDVLMVVATIHGDEAAGTPLVAAFADWLRANPQELVGRRVVIVPVANPDGMAANRRYNLRDVDLNRNFAT
ncbi:MAG: DUF2817 domain-containing protein, partial [Planctomycetota bacterium]